MIYIPKIAPFSITQARKGNNLPLQSDEFVHVSISREFPINQDIVFQFQADTTAPDVFVNGTSLTFTDITPSGWNGEGTYVYEVSYTPTESGILIFVLHETGFFFESEMLTISSSCDGLLKLKYSNSKNDYGYVDGSDLISYQWGDMIDVKSENEISSFKNDRGQTTILRATPIEAYEVTFYYCDVDTVNRLNMIFSCDSVEINQLGVEVSDGGAAERIDASDMFNFKIKLYRKEDDYNKLTTLADELDFIVDTTEEILTDNLNNTIIL